MPPWPPKLGLEKREPMLFYFFSWTWSFFQHAFLERGPGACELCFLIFELRKVLTPLNICLHSRVIATNYNAFHRVGTAVGGLANVPSTQRLSRGTTARSCWPGWIHSLVGGISNSCLQSICRREEWLRAPAVEVDSLGELSGLCLIFAWPWARTHYLLKSWFLYLEYKVCDNIGLWWGLKVSSWHSNA